MAHFTLKKSETIHAMTIDILDDQNNIQLNINSNGMLNLTWIWDGLPDKKEEKKRLLDEIQEDLIYIQQNYGDEMADNILKTLYHKIDTAYVSLEKIKK